MIFVIIPVISVAFWASLVAQLVKNLPTRQETPVRFLEQEDCLGGRIGYPAPLFMGFPGGSDGKESACDEGDPGSIPGSGRSPGDGKGYPRQYSGLENSMGSQRVGHD